MAHVRMPQHVLRKSSTYMVLDYTSDHTGLTVLPEVAGFNNGELHNGRGLSLRFRVQEMDFTR